jgi:hypothetical protein
MGTGGRVCGALSRVAAIVTSFTVAHSITLALAALHVVQLPARLTESAIALSVIAAALNNLFQVLRGRPWALQRCDPVSGGSSRCSCHLRSRVAVPGIYLTSSQCGRSRARRHPERSSPRHGEEHHRFRLAVPHFGQLAEPSAGVTAGARQNLPA